MTTDTKNRETTIRFCMTELSMSEADAKDFAEVFDADVFDSFPQEEESFNIVFGNGW